MKTTHLGIKILWVPAQLVLECKPVSMGISCSSRIDSKLNIGESGIGIHGQAGIVYNLSGFV
eukprot:15365195-Ditylum_brightwellii.AAC.2